MVPNMKLIGLCLSLFLLGALLACDPPLIVKVTNKTNDELVVYFGRGEPTQPYTYYYLVGIISPGKTADYYTGYLIGDDIDFSITAEKNVGQDVIQMGFLPASHWDSVTIVYAQSFERKQFKGNPRITIT